LIVQDVHLQSWLDQNSLEALCGRARTSPGNETPVDPLPFQPDSLLEKLTETAKIMLVDDSPVSIRILQEHLKAAGYQHFITTTDPRPVLQIASKEMPDVLLTDIVMPYIGGLEILRHLRADARLSHIPTIVLTASCNEPNRIAALKLGAVDFLSKPVNATELVVRVRNALLAKAHHDQLKDYARVLEQQVRRRTVELAASRLELIHCLARTAEFRDNETGRHVVRVGRYAEMIAEKLGLNDQAVELIGHAAPLHDMGKVGVPDSVLLKPGKLTPDEFELMQKHSVYGRQSIEPMTEDDWRKLSSHTFMGEKIMDASTSPVLSVAAVIALTHHERWDGKGYPHGLKGEEIPLAGRITSVADVFDALSSKRPYKPAFELNRCFEIMEEGSGTQFDPKVLDAFLTCRETVTEVHRQFADPA
jgi:putative two-component system response regulator